MDDMVFQKLRKHLDSFQSSFPLSEDNIEIRILKKILSKEEAEIAVCLPLIMSDNSPKASRMVAQGMASKSGLVLRLTKEALNSALNATSLVDALEMENRNQTLLGMSGKLHTEIKR